MNSQEGATAQAPSENVGCFIRPGGRNDVLKAADIVPLLRERIAYLSGGRDRKGGPILTFPSNTHPERVKHEDLKKLLKYLSSIPSAEVRECGFSVILDMRGSTWQIMKPVLKTLQDHFPFKVNAAFIIKPEKFWEKHRTSIGSSKYKFETSLISVDGLHKVIDPSNITREFDGSMDYNHEQWIHLRLLLEEFIWKALQLLKEMKDLEDFLKLPQLPDDVKTAQFMLDEHNKLLQTIARSPVEQLSAEGQTILAKISNTDNMSRSQHISGNADFQCDLPRVTGLLKDIHSKRHDVNQLWQARKARLDQCFQLRVFEDDVEKMLEWIYHNRDVFLMKYTNIGKSHQSASDLQAEHTGFTSNCMDVYVNISRIIGVADKLCENGHYAAGRIQIQSCQIQREWKSLAAALDDRSGVLVMSVEFHRKVEQVTDMEITVVLGLTLILLIIFSYLWSQKKSLQPPGPRPLPLLGNLWKILSMKYPAKEITELSKKHGPVMQVKLGPRSCVILSTQEAIYDAFVTNSWATLGRPVTYRSTGTFQRISTAFTMIRGIDCLSINLTCPVSSVTDNLRYCCMNTKPMHGKSKLKVKTVYFCCSYWQARPGMLIPVVAAIMLGVTVLPLIIAALLVAVIQCAKWRNEPASPPRSRGERYIATHYLQQSLPIITSYPPSPGLTMTGRGNAIDPSRFSQLQSPTMPYFGSPATLHQTVTPPGTPPPSYSTLSCSTPHSPLSPSPRSLPRNSDTQQQTRVTDATPTTSNTDAPQTTPAQTTPSQNEQSGNNVDNVSRTSK